MKVITEAVLRNELRAEIPETYTIPEGKENPSTSISLLRMQNA